MKACRIILLALLCLSATALAQDAQVAQDGHAAAEAFFSSLPAPVEVVRGPAFLTPAPGDAVMLTRGASSSGFTAGELTRLQTLAEELDRKYGADQNGRMADPLWKEMQSLVVASAQRANSGSTDALAQKAKAFTQATRAWLKEKSLSAIPAWTGRMVLLLDGPVDEAHPEQILRYSALVDFTADTSYYDTSLGRQVWSGGYDVTFCSDEVGSKKDFGGSHPQRTIKRPGKAFSQMFLGREGWFVKFQKVRSNDFFVPLPRLSSALPNMAFLDVPEARLERVAGDAELLQVATNSLGQELTGSYIQGFPTSTLGGRQRGAVTYKRPSGARVRVGWDFAPAAVVLPKR